MKLKGNAIGAIILVMCLSIPGIAQTKSLKKHPGKAIYEKYNCMACHGKDGISPFNMTKASSKYDTSQMILFIKDPAKFGNARMPAFDGIINENEYKILISYIILLGRTSSKEN